MTRTRKRRLTDPRRLPRSRDRGEAGELRYALTAERMRRAELDALALTGPTLADLMERAAEAVVAEVLSMAPSGRVVILAGRGNNGGDGWSAARLLRQAGRDVQVFAPAGLPSSSPAGEAAERAIADGVCWMDRVPDAASSDLQDAALLVDAIFGFGLVDAPRHPLDAAIGAIRDSGRPTLSVDVPSGVDSDTGRIPGEAVYADVTVTFTALKPGLLMFPGAATAGEIRLADIGVPPQFLGAEGDLELPEDADYAALIPLPALDAHKNSRGRVLVVGGSGAFPGAAVLAAAGAQRSGAGYVTLAVPESVAAIANAALHSAVVVPLPENPSHTLASKAADTVMDLAAEHDAVVLGPGLTLAHGAVLAARTLVARAEAPLVVDADALNALVDAVGLLASRRSETVITPHPGELGRLLGVSASQVQDDRLSYAERLAEGSVTCVLKGARTVVAGAGRRLVDRAGTVALAHAGTGDVLAGVTGTLLAQGLSGFDAAALAVYLHGWAGRLAGESGSELAVTAEDVVAHLPGSLRRLSGR